MVNSPELFCRLVRSWDIFTCRWLVHLLIARWYTGLGRGWIIENKEDEDQGCKGRAKGVRDSTTGPLTTHCSPSTLLHIRLTTCININRHFLRLITMLRGVGDCFGFSASTAANLAIDKTAYRGLEKACSDRREGLTNLQSQKPSWVHQLIYMHSFRGGVKNMQRFQGIYRCIVNE